jgi:hypothetical protein
MILNLFKLSVLRRNLNHFEPVISIFEAPVELYSRAREMPNLEEILD